MATTVPRNTSRLPVKLIALIARGRDDLYFVQGREAERDDSFES
jgi:hypothetical protein